MGYMLLALLLSGILSAPAQSGSAPQPPGAPAARPPQAAGAADQKAEAYYQFLLGRYLEDGGNVEEAIKAYEAASRLDPDSADALAELSALYARQLNRNRDAIATAEKALKVDPDNVEAHRVLGALYAQLAQSGAEDRPAAGAGDSARQAIEHLEAVQRARGSAIDPGSQLALAHLYVKTGAFDKAVPVLTRFRELEPDVSDAVTLLAQAYTGAGQLSEAAAMLKNVVADQPQFYPTLAEIYERQQRWGDAADAYQKAAGNSPRNYGLKMRWAYALLNADGPGQPERARDLLAEVVRDNPADGQALFLLAEAQRRTNDLDGAEATARRLIAVNPKGTSGPYVLAGVFEQRGQYQRVVDTLQPIVSSGAAEDSDLKSLLVRLASAYEELGQFDQAISTFERARQASPSDPALDAYLVQANLAAKRPAAAVELARRAHARHPGDLRLARLEAEALRQHGEIDAGVTVLQEAVRAHADDPVAYAALAELYTNAERYADAERTLEDAGTKFPKDLSIPFQRGAVFERQKRYADAEREFKSVLGRDPLHAPALNYLGYMLADRGVRLDESVGYIRRALDVDPNNPAYLDSLGWAYFKLDKLDLAEKNLRQAAEQRRRDSVVQDHFGDLLFKLGRYDQAITAWERALAGDRESIEAAVIDRKIKLAREKAGQR